VRPASRERRHDQSGAEEVERGGAPRRIARLPEDHVAHEGRDEECHWEWNEHRMERVTGDLGCTLRVTGNHDFLDQRLEIGFDVRGGERFPLDRDTERRI
jgi:hypothetical protein